MSVPAHIQNFVGAAVRVEETHIAGYYVTEYGDVVSENHQNRGKPGYLTPTPTKRGYFRVTMGKYNPSGMVHRMVAVAFLGAPPFPEAVVRHKDNNQANNAASNLLWGTQQDNIDDKVAAGRQARGEQCPRAQLTGIQVEEIKRRLVAGDKCTTIARDFGVSSRVVKSIRSGESWKHIPFPGTLPPPRTSSKFSVSDVQEIRRLISEGVSDTEIAARYQVRRETVGNLRRGFTWKD